MGFKVVCVASDATQKLVTRLYVTAEALCESVVDDLVKTGALYNGEPLDDPDGVVQDYLVGELLKIYLPSIIPPTGIMKNGVNLEYRFTESTQEEMDKYMDKIELEDALSTHR